MKIIPRIITRADFGGNLNKVAMHEGEMLKHIGASMNAMRLIGLVPDFEMFRNTEGWWMASKNWSPRAKAKYRAWWDAIRTLQRNPKDSNTVSLLLGHCLCEAARRNYGTAPALDFGKIGETDEKQIELTRAYVREHYTALDPEFAVVHN